MTAKSLRERGSWPRRDEKVKPLIVESTDMRSHILNHISRAQGREG
jgi:hypothetical protein